MGRSLNIAQLFCIVYDFSCYISLDCRSYDFFVKTVCLFSVRVENTVGTNVSSMRRRGIAIQSQRFHNGTYLKGYESKLEIELNWRVSVSLYEGQIHNKSVDQRIQQLYAKPKYLFSTSYLPLKCRILKRVDVDGVCIQLCTELTTTPWV